MKKRLLIAGLILILALAFIACEKKPDDGGNTPDPVSPVIQIISKQNTVEIKDEDVENYDFCALFEIYENGAQVTVESSYIDKSKVPTGFGTGEVTCYYKGKTLSVTVNVSTTVYELSVAKNRVELLDADVKGYDFLVLFTATKDGEPQEITADMVVSTVKPSLGEYLFTVNYHGKTKSVAVIVDNGVTVETTKNSIKLDDRNIAGYDYKKVFVITTRGKYTEVKDEYIDKSHLTFDGGYVECTYEGKTARIIVEANVLDYKIVKTRDTLTLHTSVAEKYDYLGLFVCYVNGVREEITKDNLVLGVKATPGTYTVKAIFGREEAVVTVTITAEHVIEAIPAYYPLTVRAEDIESHDFKEDFWLFVDEFDAGTDILEVDVSNLIGAQAGETKTITVTVRVENTTYTQTFEVMVLSDAIPVITAKNVVTYPNSSPIDKKTLFTITEDGKNVPVTDDMIGGDINYSKEGKNEITLTYKGKTAVSVVELKRGVVINVVKDTVLIKKGTDKDAYDFSSDFEVMVNGIRFNDLERYIDVSEVDFNQEGEYTATITVKYRKNQFSVAKTTESVTYKVAKDAFEIGVKEENVVLPIGAASYDFASNVRVIKNGVKQNLTSNPEWTDGLTVYYKLISAPDFTVAGTHEVVLEVYPYGEDGEKVTVRYNLTCYAGIIIKGTDKAVFSGKTITPRDIFEITDNGEEVYPTYEMLEGKVDVHTPGVYVVKISYKRLEAESRIVVIDSAMKGEYKTGLFTIYKEAFEDSEGYIIEGEAARPVGDMRISESGEITVEGKKAEILGAIDEKTMIIKIVNNEFTLHYENGIIVLDPDNSRRMQFTNDRRPLVYFNKAIWQIEKKLTVNTSDTHVLQNTYKSCSIDTFLLKSEKDESVTKWYGLMVKLLEKGSADTIYKVTYGNVTYADGFKCDKGEESELTFDGEKYVFNVNEKDDTVAKIKANAVTSKKYSNKTFTCMVDGRTATLMFDNNEKCTYITKNGKEINGAQAGNDTPNAYYDYEADVVFVYSYEKGNFYSSKFVLDLKNNTFTIAQRDELYGYYVFDNKFLFIDGYGTGHISYNNASYVTAQVRYERFGSELIVTAFNYAPSYGGDTEVTFYVSDLLNLLTVKESSGVLLGGAQFVNELIGDGALVTMGSYIFNAGTSTNTILEQITIITKDGELDLEAKKNCVDVTKINVNGNNEFCQFTVTLTVGGKEVVSYYAVEYRQSKNLCNGKELAVDYGSGIGISTTSLCLDGFGNAKLVYGETIYLGSVTAMDDNSFVAKVRSDKGAFISLKGEKKADMIMTVTATGDVGFRESFLLPGTNKPEIIGSASCVLRRIVKGAQTKYFLAANSADVGSEAEVTIISGTDINEAGTVVKLSANGKEYYVKIKEWGNATGGLTEADKLIGTYKADGKPDLVLDGFGKARLGDEEGEYVINAHSAITFKNADKFLVFVIRNKTYAEYDIEIDIGILARRTFTHTYSFVCGDSEGVYTAETTFVFLSTGKVIVKSTSADHDQDCENRDLYKPSFVTSEEKEGVYIVSRDTVTITVGETTFVFSINDVTEATALKCESTTLESGTHGFFNAGTTFTLKTE